MGKPYSLGVSLRLIEANLWAWLSLDLGKHLAIPAEDIFLGTAEVDLIS